MEFSIVIPVYQNASSLPSTIPAMLNLAKSLAGQTEVIFVDDGSNDASWNLIQQAQKDFPDTIRAVRFTRNFGQRAATLAGIAQSKGKAIGVISADLQDPPELFQKMLEEWRRGKKLVIATRTKRQDGWWNDLLSAFFYRTIRRLAIPDYPKNGFDFYLMDREIADIVLRASEKHGHLMMLIFSLGYPYSVYPYERGPRLQGKSQYTFFKKWLSFYDAIFANSFAPIRFVTLLGASTALMAFLYGVYVIISWWWNYPESRQVNHGWASIVVLITFFSGCILLSLGILGEYLWRMFEEVRRRPLYVIDSALPQN